MLLAVRPDSPVPIYEQIAAQVVFGVAAGDPPPGELVPSVRDLAQRLLVNPNTVARAYQDLERMGVLEGRRGRGMEATAEAPALGGAGRGGAREGPGPGRGPPAGDRPGAGAGRGAGGGRQRADGRRGGGAGR